MESGDEFIVRDSGARQDYGHGFVRDIEDGKHDFARILQIPGLHLIPVEALERWAAHMVKGAVKYGDENWRQAEGEEAVRRFDRSCVRHLRQRLLGDRKEDHAAAETFNIWAAEITREKGASWEG